MARRIDRGADRTGQKTVFLQPAPSGIDSTMDDSPAIRFEPVPLRSRRDGWTAERQRAFIRLIRAGLKPGLAAARLGMRRQGAYELRDRPGAAGFAAAWDEAAAAARRSRTAERSRDGLYARAVEGIARPVRYRGRIVAIERRYDDKALIRLIGIVERTSRNPTNGGGGFLSPLDDGLLSAFDSFTANGLVSETPGNTDRTDPIGGGGPAILPLETVPETRNGDSP